METATQVLTRPAEDIRADVESIIENYPPLRESHPHVEIEIDAENGIVTLRGNVRTPIMRRVLVDSTAQIPGVREVRDELFDDQSLRFAVAQLMPPGVYVRVNHGRVVLSGNLGDDERRQQLLEKAASVPGVRGVVDGFYVPEGGEIRMSAS